MAPFWSPCSAVCVCVLRYVSERNGEHGGTLGMVPLIINPTTTLYSELYLGLASF